jgi:hypothetical protein
MADKTSLLAIILSLSGSTLSVFFFQDALSIHLLEATSRGGGERERESERQEREE